MDSPKPAGVARIRSPHSTCYTIIPVSDAYHYGRTPGPAWTRVAYGLHARVGLERSELLAWASVLFEHSGFTHLTAAAIRGWWLPPLPAGLPEFAAAPSPRNRPRRDGLRIIRTTPPPTITWLDGLPVVSAEDTLLTCARHLSLIDLVVLVDAALHTGATTVARLEVAVGRRRHGVRRLRAALALADGRSESPYETLLRLVHVFSGLVVVPQHEVWQDGRLVARADLWLAGTRDLPEYDGGHHRLPAQHRRDLRRDRDLANAGWVRRGYTDHEVLFQPRVIVRDADRAVGRPHDPACLDSWYAHLRESCFTPSGRVLLLARLGLDG